MLCFLLNKNGLKMMKEKINKIRTHWANGLLDGDMQQGGDVLPADTVLVRSILGEPLLSMRDLLVLEEQIPSVTNAQSESSAVDAVDIGTEIPPLGVNCVIWCSGEPRVDRLVDEGHYTAYWEDSMYAYGDEDKFMVLPV